VTVRRFRRIRSVLCRDRQRRTKADYVYFEEPGRRAAAKLLTKDEARQIAANIAKLPELRILPLSGLQHLAGFRADKMNPPAGNTVHGFVNLAIR
jgi:hypothetical protein